MALEEEGAEGVDTEAEKVEEAGPEAQAEAGADTESEQEKSAPTVEDIASRMGWVPKEKFRGDEAKWKPADQFIVDGREIQDRTARELREMRVTLDTVTKTSASIMEQKLAEQHEALQSKYETAVAKGDPDEIWKAAQDLNGVIVARKSGPEASRSTPAPETEDWVAKNAWFDPRAKAKYDPVAHKRALDLADDYAKAGFSAGEQLTKTEAIIRREFPHLFDDKGPAQVNGPTTRNSAPAAKKSGTYADMPKEAQKIADDLVDRSLIKDREQYARNYFAQAAKGQ